MPAASVRVAAAAGPFVPAGRRSRLSAPSERPPWGQRGPHRLAPPTSQLQPGPPQLPVPPSLPGPKNDLVLLFGFGREGRACPGPGFPGRFSGPRVTAKGPAPARPSARPLPRSPRGQGKRCKLPGEPEGLRVPGCAARQARDSLLLREPATRQHRGARVAGPALRRGPTHPGGARGDCVAEVTALSRGGGGERRSTWLRGSHCGGRETPPHAAAHPPSRGGLLRAAGSGEAALPRPDGERQCVSAPHAPLLRLPPHRGHSCSPAPRRAAPESAVAAATAGKGCGPAALTRRRGPGLDVPLLPAAGTLFVGRRCCTLWT